MCAGDSIRVLSVLLRMNTVRASKRTPLEGVYSYSYVAVNPREPEK